MAARKGGMKTGTEVARISVKVSPDTDNFRKELKAELDAIEKGMEVKIKVVPDLDHLKQKVRAELANMPDAKIKLDIDTNGIRQKIKAAIAGAGGKADIEIKAKLVDTYKAQADLRYLIKAMQAYADAHPIKLKTKIDTNQLAQLKRMMGNGPGGGGGFGGGFGGMGTMLLVAGVASLLAPALALISGALVALPALIAAIAAPIGVLALGMDGFAEAVKPLLPIFDQLQKTMSKKVEDVFTPIFKNLIPIMPALTSGMPAIVDAVGELTKGFTEYFTDSPGLLSDKNARPGLEHIKAIFANISETITAMAPAVTKFTDGLLYMTSGVTAKLPAVSNWFERVSDSFQNWVAKQSVIGADGRTPIDRAMSNLGLTLNGVFDIIGDLANQGFEWLQDPEFGNKMIQFVADVKSFVNDTLPAFKDFFFDIADAMRDITRAIDKVKGVKLPDWLKNEDPDSRKDKQKPSVVGKWGPFPGFMDDGKGWAGASKHIAEMFGNLSPATLLTKLIPKDKLKEIFGMPGLKRKADGSVDAPLLDSFKNFFKMPEMAKNKDGSVDAPFLDPNWWKDKLQYANVPNLLMSLIPQDFWSNLGSNWSNGMSMAIQGIQDAWNGVTDFFSNAWGSITSAASSAWNGVVSTIQGVISTIAGIVQGLPGMISGAWQGIVATAQSTWSQVVSAVQTAISQFVSAVQTGISQVLSFFSSLPGQIVGMLSNLGSQLFSAGANAVGQLVAGLKSVDVKGAVAGVLGGIGNLIPHSPAKEGPFSGSGWTALFTGGEAIGNQFGDGIESGMGNALQTAKELAAKIKAAMDAGGDPNSALSGVRGSDLKQMLAALEEERKRLTIQKDQLGKGDKAGRAALQNQLDQIKAQKDLLSYGKDRIKNEKDYGSAAGSDPLVRAASTMMSSPVNFAKATGKQFMSDIGIGGNGLISKAIEQGIQYVFQIGSVDEAMSIKDREERKQSLAVVGRTGA